MSNENNKPMIFSGELIELIKILFDAQSKGICTVFINISGHVQLVDVRIFKDSWVSDSEADFDSSIYIDDDDNNLKIKELKKEVVKFLDSIDELEPYLS